MLWNNWNILTNHKENTSILYKNKLFSEEFTRIFYKGHECKDENAGFYQHIFCDPFAFFINRNSTRELLKVFALQSQEFSNFLFQHLLLGGYHKYHLERNSKLFISNSIAYVNHNEMNEIFYVFTQSVCYTIQKILKFYFRILSETVICRGYHSILILCRSK